jgi:pyrrolidone-carboxylate peptidase
MGFIHVPPLPEMVRDEPGRAGMSMETLIEAARVIITTAAEPIRQG